MSVIVGSRDNCIVRNAKFGDDKETVKEWEDAKSIDPSTLGVDDNVLVYETKLNGIDVYVSYYFNSSNKLTKIAYINTSSHINNQSFINDYDEIEESLEKKYGVPDEKEYSQNSSAKYSANEGDAIRLGNAMRYTLWNKDGYMIAHTIQSDDGLGILHGIQYEANDHEGTSINESDI